MSIAFDNPDEVYLIYGDEYESVAWSLCELLLDALCEQAGDEQVRWGRSISYN